MIKHIELTDQSLRQQLKSRTIRLGGNTRLKIYGSLNCKSGKRMKRENRVFFTSEVEATKNGYRPCGHCMKEAYKEWISLNK